MIDWNCHLSPRNWKLGHLDKNSFGQFLQNVYRGARNLKNPMHITNNFWVFFFLFSQRISTSSKQHCNKYFPFSKIFQRTFKHIYLFIVKYISKMKYDLQFSQFSHFLFCILWKFLFVYFSDFVCFSLVCLLAKGLEPASIIIEKQGRIIYLIEKWLNKLTFLFSFFGISCQILLNGGFSLVVIRNNEIGLLQMKLLEKIWIPFEVFIQ